MMPHAEIIKEKERGGSDFPEYNYTRSQAIWRNGGQFPMRCKGLERRWTSLMRVDKGGDCGYNKILVFSNRNLPGRLP